MDIAVAWLVFPAVLLALATGWGCAVSQLCRVRLPGELVPPLGFAAIVVVSGLVTLLPAAAPFATPVVVGGAAAGLAAAWPWSRPSRAAAWPAAAASLVFVAYAAPIVLSGTATYAGFLTLDDTATLFAMTDRMLEHGRTLDGLAPVDVRGDARDEPDGRLPDGVAAAARDRRRARRRGRRLGVPAVPRGDRSAARAGALARAVVGRPDELVAARRRDGRRAAGAPLCLRPVDRREGADRGAARCAGGDACLRTPRGSRLPLLDRACDGGGGDARRAQRRRRGLAPPARSLGARRWHGRRSACTPSPRRWRCWSCLLCPPSRRRRASSATGT